MSKTYRFNKKEYNEYSNESKKQKNFRKERIQRHNREDDDSVDVYAYIPPKKQRKQYYDER